MAQTGQDCIEIVITPERLGPARRMTGVYVEDDDQVRHDGSGMVIHGAWAMRFASASEARLYARLLRATARSSYQVAAANIIDAEVG